MDTFVVVAGAMISPVDMDDFLISVVQAISQATCCRGYAYIH